MTYLNSIIAFAGPKRELKKINIPNGTYDKIIKFETPDDYGEYPDLGAFEYRYQDEDGSDCIGYDAEKFQSDMEDHQLYPYMLKCVDAVTEYITKKSEILEKLHFQNIMTTMNGPKFGGRVFCVAGFVTYESIQHSPRKINRLILVGN